LDKSNIELLIKPLCCSSIHFLSSFLRGREGGGWYPFAPLRKYQHQVYLSINRNSFVGEKILKQLSWSKILQSELVVWEWLERDIRKPSLSTHFIL